MQKPCDRPGVGEIRAGVNPALALSSSVSALSYQSRRVGGKRAVKASRGRGTYGESDIEASFLRHDSASQVLYTQEEMLHMIRQPKRLWSQLKATATLPCSRGGEVWLTR